MCRWVAAQSVFYHLYNQVSYMSLDQISPLTFSIGNTMKRISVIVSSIIIFHTPVHPINALGAAIAILGTFLYSQVNSHLFHLSFNSPKFSFLLLSLFSLDVGTKMPSCKCRIVYCGSLSMPPILWQQRRQMKMKTQNS